MAANASKSLSDIPLVSHHSDYYYQNSTTRVADQSNVAPGKTACDYDTGNRFVRTSAGWLQIVTSGLERVAVAVNEAGFAENVQTDYLYSGTAAAVGTTPDISGYGLPFDKLKFTKSASVDTVTIRLGLSGAGRIMFRISGLATETVAVVAQIDGTNDTDAICVRRTDGTFAAATALGNGTYYLVLG